MKAQAFALLLAAAVAAVLPTAAGAQPFGQQGGGRGGPPVERPMLRADANGDGVVSPQERAAFQAQRRALCPFAGGQRPAGAGSGPAGPGYGRAR